MAEGPGSPYRPPLRVMKWLGHDVVHKNPLIRMLHEARAEATAPQIAPAVERRTYRIKRRRFFARGRDAADAVAAPPEPPAADTVPADDDAAGSPEPEI